MSDGVARILTHGAGRRGYAGMGIVVDKRHVLTCAHVLNASMKAKLDAQAEPQGPFEVEFPFCRHAPRVEGAPVIWKPMGEAEDGDIALLKLASDIPPEVGVAHLLERCDLATGAPLAVFGTPAGEPEGQIALGSYTGKVEKGRHQFDGTSFANLFVQPGYSGAAVWSDRRFVVGMTTSHYSGAQLSAHMTPVEVIRRVIGPVTNMGIRAKEPERSTVFLFGKGRERRSTVTGDAISLYSRYVARIVEQRMPEATVKASMHAWRRDDQRFFYIADAAQRVNTLASEMIDDDTYPLSYEFFFHEGKLDAATNFDVGLVWTSDSDEYLFGVYGAVSRMGHYVHELSAELPGRLAVDYLRSDPQGNLEIGYNRQIVRPRQ